MIFLDFDKFKKKVISYELKEERLSKWLSNKANDMFCKCQKPEDFIDYSSNDLMTAYFNSSEYICMRFYFPPSDLVDDLKDCKRIRMKRRLL